MPENLEPVVGRLAQGRLMTECREIERERKRGGTETDKLRQTEVVREGENKVTEVIIL